jgi:hypothetical protein
MRPRLEALEIRLTPSATHLVIITPPPDLIAGQAFSETVAAEDDAGNVDKTYSDGVIVSLVSNSGAVNLLGTTSALMVGGVATLSGLTVDTAGSYQLQAASSTLVTSSSPSFDVRAGAAAQLAVTYQPPATVVAGQTFGITVAVGDQFGNPVSSFNGNLAVTQSNAAVEGSLGGTLTVKLDNGQATFDDLSLVNASTPFTLQVSTTGLPSVTTSPFSVMAGSPTQLGVVSAPPTTVAAGVGFGLVLAAQDAYGNVNSSFSGKVTLALGGNLDPHMLAGNTTQPFSGGLATFSGLKLFKAGPSYTLQATSSGLTFPTQSPLAFSVTPDSAAQIVQTSTPLTTVTVGVGFGLALAAEDQYGNVDPAFFGPVTLALASNPGGSTLGGSTTASFSNGLAGFTGLTLDNVGKGYKLLAASSGLAPATTGLFDVVTLGTTTTGGGSSGGTTTGGGSSSGTTSTGTGSSSSTMSTDSGTSDAVPHLVISSHPASVIAGDDFQLSVVVEDASGDTETSFSGKITLSLASNPGGAILGGTLTMPVHNGRLTFYGLTLNAAGSGYTIQATSNSFSPAVSSPITVVNRPAMLVIATQLPPSLGIHQTFGLTIAVEDASGIRVPSYNGSVTIALVGKHGGTSLHGPRTVNAIDGIATFSGLSLRGARRGTHLVMQVTADGIAGASAAVFVGSAAPKPHASVITRARRRP